MTEHTSGTLGYEIILPEPYHFNRAFPLEITHADTGWLVECIPFDEYGIGATFEEASLDLGESIVELYHLSKKRKAKGHKLGQPLEDLITICEKCHGLFHKKAKIVAVKKKPKRKAEPFKQAREKEANYINQLRKKHLAKMAATE